MRKKILTSLLVGAALSGVANKNIFAIDDLSVNNTNNSSVKNIDFLNKMNVRINYGNLDDSRYDNHKKEYNRVIDGHTQPFYNIGFQAFYDPERKWTAYGCVSNFTEDKFKVMKGFFDIDGNLYHSNEYGYSSIGLQNIDGDLYYFNPNHTNPYAKRGWQDVGGQKYFFDTTFRAKKGIQEILPKCFYSFDQEGRLQVGLKTLNGKTYNFTGLGGRALLGWCNVGNDRYYFNDMDQGAAMTGWYNTTGGTVYFDNNGKMVRGIKEVKGSGDKDGWYLFQASGKDHNAYVRTGFYTDEHTKSKDRYYFNPENGGKAHKGWYEYGSKKMYFDENTAIMANGVTEIKGEHYLFLSNGKDWNTYQAYGWYNDPVTGRRYYFDQDHEGRAVKDRTIKIGREYHTFDKDGNLISSH